LGKNLEAEDGEVEAAVVLGVGAEDLLVLGEDGAEVAAGQIGEIDVLPEQMILTAAPGKTIAIRVKLLDLAVFLLPDEMNACRESRQVSQRKVAFK